MVNEQSNQLLINAFDEEIKNIEGWITRHEDDYSEALQIQLNVLAELQVIKRRLTKTTECNAEYKMVRVN